MEHIVKRITINAEIEKVWEYLTHAEKLEQWLMPNNFEPRINKRFELECPGHKHKDKILQGEPRKDEIIQCEVLEIVPYKKLVISWFAESIGKETKVTINLEQTEDGVILTLVHSGWDKLGPDIRKEYEGGWHTFINENLKRVLGG